MKFDSDFFDKLGRSPEVVSLVNQARDNVAEIARRDAPKDTGEYADGITTEGKFQKRYVGLVVGTDPKTMIIEARTGNLARAVRKAARSRG